MNIPHVYLMLYLTFKSGGSEHHWFISAGLLTPVVYFWINVNFSQLQGCVIIFAPSRGETFQLFKDLIDDRFRDISHTENYDDGIWELHQQVYKPHLAQI